MRRRGATTLVYRGVGTTSVGAPGMITELVPLPLLYSVPGIAEPGIMTLGLLPLPVSNPEPPGVVAVRGADVMPPDGAFGEATGGSIGAKPPLGAGVCAAAPPAVSVAM